MNTLISLKEKMQEKQRASAVDGQFSHAHNFSGFMKRDGSIVPFDASKISSAIKRASEKIKRGQRDKASLINADQITEQVITSLNDPFSPYYAKENRG